MTSIAIRPIEPGDVERLRSIDAEAHGEVWSQRTFGAQIDNPHICHLVATDDRGDIVGHAASWLDGATLRITNVATAPDARGLGVATRLLLALLADPGTPEVVSLEVRPANRGAQRLYTRFGFAPVGVVPDYYQQRDDSGSRSALVMTVTDPGNEAWRRRLGRIAADVQSGSRAGPVGAGAEQVRANRVEQGVA